MGNALWVFIGTLVGALASLGATWITTRAASAAQRQRMEAEWALKHREFQIASVSELQEHIAEFARTTGKIAAFDKKTQTADGTLPLVPDELSDDHATQIRRLNVLMMRIDDEACRGSVQRLRDAAVMALFTEVAFRKAHLIQFNATYEAAGESLSLYLRSLYRSGLVTAGTR